MQFALPAVSIRYSDMSTLFEDAAPHPDGYRELEASELADAICDGAPRDVALVDVRAPFEFDGELGHIPGSKLVPLSEWPRAAESLPHDAQIVLICRTSARAAKAAAMLLTMGFRQVMILRGGIVAWERKSLPIARDAR